MSDHGWTTAAPIFRVQSLRASIQHYIGVLGFQLEWEAGGLASVKRDDCRIFLCEGDQGSPKAWAWVGVGDAEALAEDLRLKGATIRHPPTNYHWAIEMQVADPDGNVLRLGSEPRESEPEGEWLDASGRRWVRGRDGSWTQIEP